MATSTRVKIPEPSALDHTAATIRAEFVRRYRLAEAAKSGTPSNWGDHPSTWDGKPDINGVVRRSAWLRAAEVAEDNGLDALDLVSAAFRLHAVPYPNELISSRVLTTARTEYDRNVRDLGVAWTVQMTALKRGVDVLAGYGWDAARAAAAVITAPRSELSSIFRFCAATLASAGDVASQFRDGARVQYLGRRRAYDQAWGSRIPEDLRLLD